MRYHYPFWEFVLILVARLLTTQAQARANVSPLLFSQFTACFLEPPHRVA